MWSSTEFGNGVIHTSSECIFQVCFSVYAYINWRLNLPDFCSHSDGLFIILYTWITFDFCSLSLSRNIPLPFHRLHLTNLSRKNCSNFNSATTSSKRESVFVVVFIGSLFVFVCVFLYYFFLFLATIHTTAANLIAKTKQNIYLSTSRLDSFSQNSDIFFYFCPHHTHTSMVRGTVHVYLLASANIYYTFYLLWQFKELTEVSFIVFEAACQTSLTEYPCII